ncbi:class I SAM-dependent methyltransferase [Thauera aromatica]|uniref:class I SAM-dependent methyltransferase n=1 Tax=Thauera aromatica TaxID=59405 RepID=UPI001FFC8C6C|nr:class I SAM-dependent methyltransferase [Thauera aromatica]MCK2097732.1 class I SAM-dependent methyltransferase [Thauera aromatica]
MDLKEIDILGDNVSQHWYYRSKAKAMTKLLGNIRPSSILDVGAGSGFFSRHLLSNSEANEAWCVDTSYRNDSDDFETRKRIYFRRHIDHVDADLVLLMDVLEHIADDVRFLQLYIEKVPKSTKFLISVPVFECLWSSHDIFLEHKRRYTLRAAAATH